MINFLRNTRHAGLEEDQLMIRLSFSKEKKKNEVMICICSLFICKYFQNKSVAFFWFLSKLFTEDKVSGCK